MAERVFWDFFPKTFHDEFEGHDEVPELTRWLHSENLIQLKYLWSMIESVKSTDARAILEMLFSDILFACASPGEAKTRTGKRRRHHWGWIADNVLPRQVAAHDAITLFRERLAHLKVVLQSATKFAGQPDDEWITVKREDVRALSMPDNCADLVVTSPPYVGMIDYALANRLTYLWMQWPLEQDLRSELGARRFRKRPTATKDYIDAMRTASAQLARILKPERYCAIVIGASRKYPEAVADVIKVFTDHFGLFWGPKARMPSRRRISERGGSDAQEFLVVFKK